MKLDRFPLDTIAAAHVELGEAYQLLRALPSCSVDGLITDPPYSSGGATRGDRMSGTSLKYQNAETATKYADFTGDNRDQRGFLAWCALWMGEALRVCKPGAPIVAFTDWRQLPQMTDAIQIAGWIWRGIGIWDKGDMARPQLGRFRNSAEFWVWGSNGPMPFDRGVGALPGTVRANTVHVDQRQHLTEKPIEVMRLAVSIVERGGLVLDPFCGSGSTGVAARALGRRFLGFEIDPHYHRVASERLALVQPEPEPLQQLGLQI